MNDSMLMLAATWQGDLTRRAGQDKMAARVSAAARSARHRTDSLLLRRTPPPGTAARTRPTTAQGR